MAKDQRAVGSVEQKPLVTEKVEIYGESYVIKGAVPKEYIAEVAREVDERISALQMKYKGLPLYKVAVLVSLNLAGELHQARKDNEELLKLLEEAR
ncbi:MAG: cell division protein ZapA [Limnochordia bacterium]|nr:cell division protein ZapA [Limnochordia bacterium]